MFTLQLLPKYSSNTNSNHTEHSSAAVTDENNILSILMEQKSQVESFIEEATRNRRFDDVKSLKINLEEIIRFTSEPMALLPLQLNAQPQHLE